MFHGVRLGWGGIRRVVAFAVIAHGLSGCTGTPLSLDSISSTPVPTPIVVRSSPSLATPSPPQTPQAEPVFSESRHEEIEKLIKEAREAYPGHSAVVFFDLDSDGHIEFEPNTSFESASLVKLVILSKLYRQFHVGQRSPEETLVLLDSQKRGGSGSLKDAKEGTSYSLESLAELMVTESDNTATQMLTDLLGLDSIQQGAEALGLSDTTVQRDIFDFDAIDHGRDNTTSAKDITDFLRLLAHQELPGSSQMHEILERQKRNDMIGKGFPEQVRVAHKTGELDGILHDAAIVYAPRGAFILVCLSDQVSDKEKAKSIWAKMALDILKLYSDPTPSPTPTAQSETQK